MKFLDGALSSEEEAELLHRLSVSPEKRAVLRSFINQKGLFNQDRRAMNVPYEAEQKLWARLGGIMPAPEPMATAAPIPEPVVPAAPVTPIPTAALSGSAAGTATVWYRSFRTGYVSLSLVTLLVTFGLGYLLGNTSADQPKFAAVNTRTATPAPATSSTGTSITAIPQEAPLHDRTSNDVVTVVPQSTTASALHHANTHHAVKQTSVFASSAFVDRVTVTPLMIAAVAPSQDVADNVTDNVVARSSEESGIANASHAVNTPARASTNRSNTVKNNGASSVNSTVLPAAASMVSETAIPSAIAEKIDRAKAEASDIHPLAVQSDLSAITLQNIGGEDGGIQPVFQHNHKYAAARTPSFIERFEFSFLESFGREYPNSDATNVTLPVITNSAVAAHFQVLPESRALWAGVGFGTANVTRKRLFAVKDAKLPEDVAIGEYSHMQANWIGGFVQGRIPVWDLTELMASVGYGTSNAGKMMMGEVAFHYDATREVGFIIGLRGTRLTYDMQDDITALRNESKNPLAILDQGTLTATPAFNIELSTGLFFHF